jgi:DUF971 family protein
MTIDHADVGSDSDEQSVVETTRNNSHIQDIDLKYNFLFRIWYSDTIHDFGGKRNKIFPGEGPLIKLNPF